MLMGPYPHFPMPGFAYIAAAPSLNKLSDSSETPARSNMMACENNELLGPAHSLHKDIAEKGKGRFSHWKDVGIIFSSTDNSDPNVNGRRYWIVRPN